MSKGIIDMYDASTDELRRLDKKVTTYFIDLLDHYPIYFVTEKSNRGFDLSCEKKEKEIYLYILSAFKCKRHMD